MYEGPAAAFMPKGPGPGGTIIRPCVFILHRFRDTITYFSKFKDIT